MASGQNIRQGGAFVEFFATGTDKVQAALAAMKKQMQSFAVTTALIGAGIAGLGAAITVPFLAGLEVASEWGREVVAGNRRTGISFENLQSLAYALNTDIDGLATATRTMNRQLIEAATSGGHAAEALATMGLNARELLELSPDEQIRRLATGLQSIQNITERNRLAAQFLGRQGTSMNTAGGGAGIQSREARGRAAGAVMSTADVQTIARYNAATRELGIETRATWASIGIAIAPFMTQFVGWVTGIVHSVRTWINENRELVAMVFRVGDVLVTVGTAIGVLGSIIYAGSFAFTFISGAVGILASVLGFVLAPAVALVSFALSALWGIATFAAGGFGLLSLASWAWSGATVSASSIASAAMILWSGIYTTTSALVWAASALLITGFAIISAVLSVLWAAFIFVVSGQMVWVAITAIATAAAWLYNAAMIAWNAILAIASVSTWALAAAMVAYAVVTNLGSLATFLLSLVMWETAAATTFATAGINLLVAALSILIAAVVIYAGIGMALPFLAVGTAVWAAVKGLLSLGAMFGRLTSAASGIGGAFGDMGRIIGTAFSDAASQTAESFEAIWPAMVANATSAWGGIKDAFAVGDWGAIWEIIQATALLTWEQVKRPVILMLYSWMDAFVDTFTSIWTTLKIMFAEGWGFVRAGWFGVLLDILNRWEDVQEAISVATEAAFHPLMTDEERAETAADRNDARRARTQELTDQTLAARQQGQLDRERIQREAAVETANREAARRNRDAAVEAGDPEEVARLQAELDQLTDRALVARWQATEDNADAVAEQAGGGDLGAHGAGSVQGTFNAAAVRGFIGGGSTSQDRIERLATEQRDFMREIRDAIQRLQPFQMG